MWLRPKIAVSMMAICLLLGMLGAIGCKTQGRIHAGRSQIVGVYEIKLQKGTEDLELKSDGTYVQDVIAASQSTHHSGRWQMEGGFMGGSDVVLLNAVVTDDDDKMPPRFGDMTLNVHDHAGKLALARNEAADWYFERIR